MSRELFLPTIDLHQLKLIYTEFIINIQIGNCHRGVEAGKFLLGGVVLENL